MKNQQKRQQYFVDVYVQTGIVQRIAIYWVASVLFLTLPIAFANTITHPEIFFFSHVGQTFATHWPVYLMMLVFLPFALNDAIRFSNRFTGPVYRLRSELRKFKENGKLGSIKFRDGDFWQDLAEGVNQVSKRLAEVESELQLRDRQHEETLTATNS